MKKLIALWVTFLLLLSFAPTQAASNENSILIPFAVQTSEGKRWGYLNSETKAWQITPQYLEAQAFTQEAESLAWVKLPNDGYTLINITGKQIISPMPFTDVAPPSEGLARFKIGSDWGYLSVKDGSFVISPAYDQAREFSGGLAAVEVQPQKWRFIHPNGNKSGLQDFSFAYSFEGDTAIVLEMDGFYGLIGRDNQWHVPPIFGAIYRPALGEKNYLVGKVDKGKKKFIPYYEIVNSTGFAINSMKFDEVKHFKAGGAPVRQGDKWGYVTLDGQWLIQPQFEDVQAFTTSSVGAVKKDGLWGVVYKYPFNTAEYQWIVPPTWQSEPDMSFFAPNSSPNAPLLAAGKFEDTSKVPDYPNALIRVDGYFYNAKGVKLEIYPNFILDGEAALKKSDKVTAKAAFEKALLIAPNDKAALYGLERANSR